MANYRRNFAVGGTYFFTVNLADRRRALLTEHIGLLRASQAMALMEGQGYVQPSHVYHLARFVLAHRLMPKDPAGDALHLALASHHRCDFLVTWNCRHLANANKFDHIRRVNGLLGLFVPSLVTPLELLGDPDE